MNNSSSKSFPELIQPFTETFDQALTILGVEDKVQRERMVFDVVVFLWATAFAKISQRHLSSQSKQRLSEIMQDSQNFDRAQLEERWQATMQVINDGVSSVGGLKADVVETIQETLGEAMSDYLVAITKDATEEQKKKLAELLEKQVQAAR